MKVGVMAPTIRAYTAMPHEARDIRERVFIRERAWRPEFDEKDEQGASTHLLAFDDAGQAVGTCRFYKDDQYASSDDERSVHPSTFVIARLAVLPDARGRRIGSTLLDEAEQHIAAVGGTAAAVHAEYDYYQFYERRGYHLTDDVYENGRHGWLVKPLTVTD